MKTTSEGSPGSLQRGDCNMDAAGCWSCDAACNEWALVGELKAKGDPSGRFHHKLDLEGHKS